jgi:predicted nucleic acid-binding protein
MATKVLDSWALIALFNAEPAAEEVEKLLHAAATGRHLLLMHVVNWGEIYYTAMRRGGQAAATSIAADIRQMPITVVESTNFDLVRQAAIFKATKRLSYADCFAAALAKEENAEFVTGDREFKGIERELKSISWLQ